MPSQASPKPTGRELRRARNVVKNWRESYPSHAVAVDVLREVRLKRYERACAMILADKLRNS